MATVVGLDVGTHAVRAVELTLGRDRPVLTGFGQVALPVGAVQHGEILDPALVSASLRRLWSEAGFRTRRVIVGVGNQRVIVRHVELPRMSEADLRSAIRFEAESLIPIPVDEAVLDFQILEEGPQATDNAMPVLLAPGWALAGRLGAGLTIALFAAWASAQTALLLREVLPFARWRGPAWAMTSFLPPFVTLAAFMNPRPKMCSNGRG